MVLHMLAIFGRETAHPPTFLESESALNKAHSISLSEVEQAEEQVLCERALDRAYSASRAGTRHKHMLGKGSGFSYETSPYCSYAHRNGVHVLFMGEVAEWPGVNAVSAAHDAFVRNEPPLEADDAHWLLDFYSTFDTVVAEDEARDGGAATTQRALECLAQIKGNFAFVVYDSLHHRVLAARDADGTQPLFWGCNDDGQLMFGSVIEDLASCNPTATAFPAGTLFASERHTVAYQPGEYGWVIEENDYPGMVYSFLKADAEHWRSVKAVPRVTSKGVLCGAVYKVASLPDVQRSAAH